jgi:hypothetical protein
MCYGLVYFLQLVGGAGMAIPDSVLLHPGYAC